MRINNINENDKTNFTSAFRFRKLTGSQYTDLRHVVSKSARQIYPSLIEKGDIVVVNQGSYDLRVQNFIKDNNLNFEYYPTIKLSEKLKGNIVKSLVLQNMSNKNFINNALVLNSKVLKDNISASKNLLKVVDKIFKTLRLNVDKVDFKLSKNGLPVIKDNTKLRTIYFSPNFNSKYYVFVKPNSANQPSSRYLLLATVKK